MHAVHAHRWVASSIGALAALVALECARYQLTAPVIDDVCEHLDEIDEIGALSVSAELSFRAGLFVTPKHEDEVPVFVVDCRRALARIEEDSSRRDMRALLDCLADSRTASQAGACLDALRERE